MLEKQIYDNINSSDINSSDIKSSNINSSDNDSIDELNDFIDNSTTIYSIAKKYNVILPLKKKRGRKSKNEIDMLNLIKEYNIFDNEIIYGEPSVVVKYKKRGRKPKGGKIIQNSLNDHSELLVKTNVILHLKCFLSDLNNNNTSSSNLYEGISLEHNNKLAYNIINSNTTSNNKTLNNNLYNEQYTNELVNNNDNDEPCANLDCVNEKKSLSKDIFLKLKDLELSLKNNNINNKKSACFYCTVDFDNPPIYIPKHLINNYYHVYGCFCSPECATGFLMKEQIDSSIKYERYFLLNNIYSKIYNFEKSIKPAPDPYYTLDKFFGNLSINEYRSLINSNRLYIIIDKPITRSLPELHEDNDDFIINNRIIPTNYSSKHSLNNSGDVSF